MRFSTVIFDLDGTVLNTLDDLAFSANLVCERHGWPTHPRDAYKLMVGNGMPKLVERFTPADLAADPDLLARTFEEFCACYDEHKEDSTCPYPGVVDMLDALGEAGVRLGVLTNKDHGAAVPLIERYFGSRFADVQGRIDSFPPKPAAPMTLSLMERLGADPAATLFVGDSNVDVMCGHNAGLPVMGVLWGFRTREELEGEGAEFIAEKPEDITQLVLGNR